MNFTKCTTIVATSFFVVAPSNGSADPTLECSVASSSQIETSACVATAEEKVNASLEAALGFAQTAAEVLDSVTGRENAVPALAASQTGWEAYRDAQCAFVGANFAGGSGTGIAITSCRVDLGRSRVNELMANAG
jgi:uncharacterized protein YecT (DUF1311 family)